MNPIAKTLVTVGAVLIVAGLVWQVASRWAGGIGLSHLGRLPGDIAIEKEHVRFYFPIVTSLLVSLVLSLILYLIRFFRE